MNQVPCGKFWSNSRS